MPRRHFKSSLQYPKVPIELRFLRVPVRTGSASECRSTSLEWLRRLPRHSPTLPPMRLPRVPEFNKNAESQVTACGRGGNLEAALSLLDGMRSKGVSPNCYTYNSAIHACARKVMSLSPVLGFGLPLLSVSVGCGCLVVDACGGVVGGSVYAFRTAVVRSAGSDAVSDRVFGKGGLGFDIHAHVAGVTAVLLKWFVSRSSCFR